VLEDSEDSVEEEPEDSAVVELLSEPLVVVLLVPLLVPLVEGMPPQKLFANARVAGGGDDVSGCMREECGVDVDAGTILMGPIWNAVWQF
jgi:hypothetical protein